MKHLLKIGILFVCYHATHSNDTFVFPTASGYNQNIKPNVQSQTLVISSTPGIASLNDAGSGSSYPLASEAINSIASRLHSLLDPGGKKNYIVSPFSIAVIVGQLLLGARGETEKRLRELLSPKKDLLRRTNDARDQELHRQLGGLLQSLQKGPSSDQSADAFFKLQAANALFHMTDIRLISQFKDDIKNYYKSELTTLDFRGNPSGSQKHINEWASKNTGGVFDAILPGPLPKTTSAVLINTLYFKADWLVPFDPELTKTAPFKLNSSHLIDVSFMRGQFDINYSDSDELRCRLIVLPYKQDDVNMYVILPHRQVTDDIKDFAETLTPHAIASLVKAATENSVTVVMPKMKLNTKFSLKTPIVSYRPNDEISSRLANDEEEEKMEDWKLVRNKNVTSTRNKTSSTTQRTPTTRPRNPTPTPSTIKTTHLPPHASQEHQESQEQEHQGQTTKPPKRPSPQKPNTRNPASTTTNKPSSTSTTTKPSNGNLNSNGNSLSFDMSGASTDNRFSIEDIIHQVSLEVSEIGTEAAAVTVVDVNYSGDIRVVKLDRPFVFFIRHEPSLSNLFWGVITDPTNGDYA